MGLDCIDQHPLTGKALADLTPLHRASPILTDSAAPLATDTTTRIEKGAGYSLWPQPQRPPALGQQESRRNPGTPDVLWAVRCDAIEPITQPPGAGSEC